MIIIIKNSTLSIRFTNGIYAPVGFKVITLFAVRFNISKVLINSVNCLLYTAYTQDRIDGLSMRVILFYTADENIHHTYGAGLIFTNCPIKFSNHHSQNRANPSYSFRTHTIFLNRMKNSGTTCPLRPQIQFPIFLHKLDNQRRDRSHPRSYPSVGHSGIITSGHAHYDNRRVLRAHTRIARSAILWSAEAGIINGIAVAVGGRGGLLANRRNQSNGSKD